MATTPENRVKAAIKNWLKKEGIFYWSAAAGPYSTHGISDILAIHRGVFYAIEVKAPGKAGNATIHQHRFIEAVRAAGGQGAVVDTLDAVKELFHVSPRKPERHRAQAQEPE